MDPNSIGERIRRMRKARGLTLESLAGEQFTKGYLSLIERGKTPPSFRVIAFIAERLGCSPSDLLGSGGDSGTWTSMAENFRMGRFCEVIEAADQIVAGDAPGSRTAQARLWQARAFAESGEHARCVEAAASILAGPDLGPVLELEACYLSARALLNLQRLGESISVADRGLGKARETGIFWPDLCARLLLNRATALMSLNHYSEAIDAFEETLNFARTHHQPGTATDALIRSAFCHLKVGNQARALDLALKVRDVRDALGDAIQQAEARIVLAMTAIAGDDREAALAYALEASNLIIGHPATPQSAEARTALAGLLTDLGQPERARAILADLDHGRTEGQQEDKQKRLPLLGQPTS